jgi:hypothetical protein
MHGKLQATTTPNSKVEHLVIPKKRCETPSGSYGGCAMHTRLAKAAGCYGVALRTERCLAR